MSYLHQGDYVRLGSRCYASSRVLTSNRKFLPPDAEVYNTFYTDMLQYPGQSYNYIATVGHIDRPEDIKTKQPQKFGLQRPPEENYQSPTKCCGRK